MKVEINESRDGNVVMRFKKNIGKKEGKSVHMQNSQPGRFKTATRRTLASVSQHG